MTTVRDETRASIVEVAARLVRDDGPVTIRAVAQAAGLQPPAIYRFFADKDALLDAVAEHVFTAYVTGKTPDASADPLADLRTGWDAHIAFGLANAPLFGLLIDPRRAASPAAAAGMAVLRARVHRVAATGRLRVTERRAVEVIHAAGTGAVLTLLAMPPDDREPGLADTMYQAVLQTILADAPAPEVATPGLSKLTAAERALLAEWLDRPGG
ncbi:TetR/AcrR family transcriptional regulator [Amycolatopsis sp., V23-08]|uniref:TetR/AcrR family transcriptional regulator n=1 Tax=Amycolatopsis heterodermiae TaxID=3110235 RepID=A0ABU5RIT1_9PSEU|nr:TetR/AcrR family transcriptional regulator [Amycolatopsis sp., V23-08]MEA5365494.1 TetR/AcrR family transcriptional regulator [Amycolatopsis sp., V23-08]